LRFPAVDTSPRLMSDSWLQNQFYGSLQHPLLQKFSLSQF